MPKIDSLCILNKGCKIQKFLTKKRLEGTITVARFFLVQQTKMGKITKWPQNMPNGCKINQMSIKIPTASIARPSKIYPIRNFCFENVPSGNPGHHLLSI
jgi:hypothetical protein